MSGDVSRIISPLRSTALTPVDVFVDRSAKIATFDSAIADLRSAVESGDALPRSNAGRCNVLAFCGMPGIGKTALSVNLEKRFLDGEYAAPRRQRLSCRIDFAQASLLDLETLTIHLRAALGAGRVRWPAFDVGFATYWSGRHPGRPFDDFVKEDSKLRKLAQAIGLTNQIESEVSKALGIPFAGAVETTVKSIAKLVQKRIETHRLFSGIPVFETVVTTRSLDDMLAVFEDPLEQRSKSFRCGQLLVGVDGSIERLGITDAECSEQASVLPKTSAVVGNHGFQGRHEIVVVDRLSTATCERRGGFHRTKVRLPALGCNVAITHVGSNRAARRGTVVVDYLRADDFADPDGSDQTAGLNRLLARARTTRRPVYFPGNLTFHHEGTLDARDTTNLILDGGSGPSSENNAIPNLVFTGTDGPALDLGSAQGTTVQQLRWEYSSPEFCGDLIQTGHSSAEADPGHLTFDRCWFAGRPGVSESARSLVNLNRAIWVDLRSCYFRYSERAIIGRDPDYSNVVKITRCSFSRQGKPPILNPGEAWSVDTCGFEPLLDDTAGAVECDPDRFAVGFSYLSNWHGDISQPGGSWLRGRLLGAAIQGNFFGTALKDGSAIELVPSSQGVSIAGNRSDCDWFITSLPGQGVIRGISVNGNSARSPANDYNTIRALGNKWQGSMIFANEAPSPDVEVTGSQTTGDALSSLINGLADGATIIDNTTP